VSDAGLFIKTISHSQTETELNEKLEECLRKRLDAGADQRETEREAKLKETLSNLQRIFPGIDALLVIFCLTGGQRTD
jgi:structural maintenance of chromosome 1